ncbi:MAG: YbhB/YbcL family Raf kinase inhibitor-like protein [Cytophagaceae bacterium]|jgi:hypothetical protein|nr:YbhB/YbcL family Raf kinase inhibitor-like protein [Cytophagaceae bacterium]
MKTIFRIACLLLVAMGMAQNTSATFTLSSNSVGGQGTTRQEFKGFGCSGENMSPQLSWKNVPAGTKSFAITMYDPDAPTGSGWWHWVLFDLPAQVTELKEGAGDPAKNLLPPGAIQGITDFGMAGFGGPCPPPGHGFHQYIITVYALSVDKLGLDGKASPATVGYYLNANTLAKSSLVFYYKR